MASAPEPPCPKCGTVREPGDRHCERCGYDFVEGRMPEFADDSWIAVVEADRTFYNGNELESERFVPFPEGLPRREVPLTGDRVVLGRRDANGFVPDIDLSSPVLDPGVSRRHAILQRRTDGSWALIDEGSQNGTWLNAETDPVPRKVPVELLDGDRIFVGAFSVITIRRTRAGG